MEAANDQIARIFTQHVQTRPVCSSNVHYEAAGHTGLPGHGSLSVSVQH